MYINNFHFVFSFISWRLFCRHYKLTKCLFFFFFSMFYAITIFIGYFGGKYMKQYKSQLSIPTNRYKQQNINQMILCDCEVSHKAMSSDQYILGLNVIMQKWLPVLKNLINYKKEFVNYFLDFLNQNLTVN